MMPSNLGRQAERLYRAFADLVRAYQFRDREGICCHGLSVSQCYTLDTLNEAGPQTMGQLADRLHLEISTMTRVVDHLVACKLTTRVTDAKDRRICRVRITAKGRTLVSKIRTELVREYERVLEAIPPGSREDVIAAMSHLLSAFQQRRRCRSDEPEPRSRPRRKVS